MREGEEETAVPRQRHRESVQRELLESSLKRKLKQCRTEFSAEKLPVPVALCLVRRES